MGPTPTAAPVRPLVIWFGRVGDLILLSTLLDLLHRRYGKPCLLIGAGAWTRDIFRQHSSVAEVWCLRRYTPFFCDLSWWHAWWALRRNPSDPVYVCEMDPRKLRRIRRLLNWAGVAPERCLFLAEEPASREAHWVDRLMAFGKLTPKALRESDFPWSRVDPSSIGPRLEVSAQDRADLDAWIQQQVTRDSDDAPPRSLAGRPLIVIQPGNRRTMRGNKLKLSTHDDKAWPLERWSALLHKIHEHMPEAVIVLRGAVREKLLLSWIREAAQLPCVVTAELPLGRSLALCQRAHSMISVDTGLAHAAAALGLPLVVMFGSAAPAEWAPRSASGSPILGVGGAPRHRRLDELSVKTVFETWLDLLRQMQQPPR